MTGAYLRVKRDDKYEAIEVEHLSDKEREKQFTVRTPEEMMRWFHLVCNKLAEVENEYFTKIENN